MGDSRDAAVRRPWTSWNLGFWGQVGGPVLTLALLGVIERLSQSRFLIPAPAAILLLALVFSASIGGLRSGLISAGFAWLYLAFYFSIPGRPFRYSEENLMHVILWAVIAPTIVLMVSLLYRRVHARTTRMLRESEGRFQVFMDNNPAVAWVKDDQGRYVYVNTPFERSFGRTLAEVTGKTDFEIHPGETARQRRERDLEVLGSNGPMESLETISVPGKPSEHWLVIRFPLLDAAGKRSVGGISIDVTERKQIEDALQESKGVIRQIVNNALDAVITIDTAGTIRSWNPRAEEMFGWPSYETKDLTFEGLLAPRHQIRYRRILRLYRAKEKWPGLGKRLEVVAVHRDCHEFPVEISVTRIRSGGAVLFSIFMRDLTENKRMESQFRQSQKMEAVGRLAGGVAHDFNNILTVIMGYGEILQMHFEEGQPMRSCADEIIKAAEKASMLTRQLLAFSRKQVMAPKIINLNTIIAETENMLRRLIGEDVELGTELSGDLGHVKADPGQIEQVLMNLAVNARDAMPQGGRLTLRSSNAALGEEEIRDIPDARPGPHARLTVTDTGQGMDAKVQSHLFEPFFTTKEKGKGTGLGLSTIYGIIKQSGGHIRVASAPGKGTTFEIYLPSLEVSPPPAAPVPTRAPRRRGSERILLVEDSDTVRRLARTVLEKDGYTVMEASNGEEAVVLSRDHAGRIDLLLTDVVMPGMSGYELAGVLAVTRPNMKILYMSGYTDDAFMTTDALGPNSAFLQKPFAPEVLSRKVREVIDAPVNAPR